ncbi:MAG: zinc ribbon domain-containing protein [Acidobacteriaceae bacterium]|jgi:hypothetical protein
MQETCHRCGGELSAGSGETPFCPHCGAPQLFLALENQSAQTGGEAGTAASTGVSAPPRARQVEWKTAIRCAAAVAGVGSVLTLAAMRVDVLTPLSLLWIMSASLITLGFYQKRKPAAWMDVRIGARIGVVVGIFLALELGVAMAGAGLVARFVLHSMGNFDAQMAAQIQVVEKTMQQQTTPVPAEYLRFINSPEFRAGSMLATFAFASVGLLVLSAVGGAFAGLLRMRRGPAV